jgi:hypothetical protein
MKRNFIRLAVAQIRCVSICKTASALREVISILASRPLSDLPKNDDHN